MAKLLEYDANDAIHALILVPQAFCGPTYLIIRTVPYIRHVHSNGLGNRICREAICFEFRARSSANFECYSQLPGIPATSLHQFVAMPTYCAAAAASQTYCTCIVFILPVGRSQTPQNTPTLYLLQLGLGSFLEHK